MSREDGRGWLTFRMIRGGGSGGGGRGEVVAEVAVHVEGLREWVAAVACEAHQGEADAMSE